MILASVNVTVGVPQLSVAVAVPKAELICAAVGLQPKVSVVPVAVITGSSVSTVQVTVRETGVAVLPHASEIFQVLVCERLQPFTITAPSAAVGVTAPQASVADAVPKAELICAAVGLHPNASVVPLAVITGAVISIIQVTVRETGVAVLPQASVTFQVLVWERLHPEVVTLLVVAVGVTDPQLSVAMAVPNASSI